MLDGTVSEQYRCLVEILTCLVCKDLVNQAHICPNCSKFYCLQCIHKQLKIEEKCLHCSRFLSVPMLSNCQKLCVDLTETLQKVKMRCSASSRVANDKSPYYCYRHKLQKTYYCQTCDRPLCSDCSVLTETHRGHQFIKLSLIKNNYKHVMGQKYDELATFSQNIDKKLKHLKEGQQMTAKYESNNFLKVQASMKTLRDNLKKKLKKLLNDSEKSLNVYNEALEQWNQCYDKGMRTLKNTSKGKFIEDQYLKMEAHLQVILQEMNQLKEHMFRTYQQTQQKNVIVNYINPEDYSYIFIVENFKEKRKDSDFFYTGHVLTKEGLQIRLKIYPKGIIDTAEEQKEDCKMIKKHSKNEDYLAIFIELVDGPASNTKLKHQILLKNQAEQGRQFMREFQSEFDVGLCWGYQNYIKLTQLYDQGYYNAEFDYVQIQLKIGPCSYYQATKDQLALMNAKKSILQRKRQHLRELQKLVVDKEGGSTAEFILVDQ